MIYEKKKLFADDVLFSRRGRMGKILSPRHTLPPNTTCTYYFHGQPGDLIWISFTSYNLQILQHAIQDNNTLGRVRIIGNSYDLFIFNVLSTRLLNPIVLTTFFFTTVGTFSKLTLFQFFYLDQ